MDFLTGPMHQITHCIAAYRAGGLPAMIMGLAAAFKLIVLNMATSMRKCSMAATKEKRVAPACSSISSAGCVPYMKNTCWNVPDSEDVA